jgi:hypothetical protein
VRAAGAPAYTSGVRDRRWDFLYDRTRQPVREWVVERFAEVLADELRAWPPPLVEWTSDAERARWAEAAGARPPDAAVRLALEIARLDLGRAWDAAERRLDAGGAVCPTPAARDGVRLLARFLSERCLDLKEHAEGARLTREDLVRCLDRVEARLSGVGAP